MKNNKGYLLVVLAAMVFLTLVSCGGNESSSDSFVSETVESSVAESSADSSVTSYDDSDVSAEPSSEDVVSELSGDSSEESSAGEQSQESSVDAFVEISVDNSKESSEDSSEESSEESSKDNSKDSSKESSEDNSKDNSKESSEDSSEDSSEESSEDSSEDSSEESSGEISDGIPEKYHNLESVKAIFALEDEYPDYIHIFMKSEMTYMGYPANIIIETYEDTKNGKSVSNFRLEALGTTMMSKTGINTGKKCYMMDDIAKTYNEVSEEDLEIFAWNKLFSNVSSVETKTEIVENESFVADWFNNKDGMKCGLYTKDGSLKYLSVVQDKGESTTEMLFEITVNEEKWDGDYKVPSGYTKK